MFRLIHIPKVPCFSCDVCFSIVYPLVFGFWTNFAPLNPVNSKTCLNKWWIDRLKVQKYFTKLTNWLLISNFKLIEKFEKLQLYSEKLWINFLVNIVVSAPIGVTLVYTIHAFFRDLPCLWSVLRYNGSWSLPTWSSECVQNQKKILESVL